MWKCQGWSRSRDSRPGAGPRRATGHETLQAVGSGGNESAKGPGSVCESAGGGVAGSGAGRRQTDFRFTLFLTLPIPWSLCPRLERGRVHPLIPAVYIELSPYRPNK